MDELIEFFGTKQDALDKFGDLPFAGGHQPKQPIPPGDSAFFYHGLCVANSAFDDPSPGTIPSVSSHSCNLNICLGGGGFNCIAFYSGTSFVFNLEPQLGFLLFSSVDDTLDTNGELSLPPPFPATIIEGTGSFEGIEGTVDIATICGTTGPTILEDLTLPCRDRRLQEPQTVGDIKLGLIVQTISINANMPLPVEP